MIPERNGSAPKGSSSIRNINEIRVCAWRRGPREKSAEKKEREVTRMLDTKVTEK